MTQPQAGSGGGKPDPTKPKPVEAYPMHDPGTEPTPEDPRQNEPMRDPPVYPEQDDPNPDRVRHADGNRSNSGVESVDPSPDEIVFDEDEVAK